MRRTGGVGAAMLLVLAVATQAPAFRDGEPDRFSARLSGAARARLGQGVMYDGSYKSNPYPGGDVSPNRGVCTDVVFRAYRTPGIDLQGDVHVEIRANFSEFPNRWGLKKPDPNIDHSRVPNLQKLFELKGIVLPVTKNPQDYVPGDIVTWTVGGNRPHIGTAVDRKNWTGSRYKAVHNIGLGPELEDMLFDYPSTGLLRYYGSLAVTGAN